jgi:hypothetical protein
MVRTLDLLKISELSWQLKGGQVGVHDSLLLEVNALLDENSGHGHQVLIRAEVLIADLIIVVLEVVLWAPDNTEVRGGLLGKSDRDLHPGKLLEVFWVLHLFEDDALLHLPDVLLFNDSQKVLEGGVDLVWIELVALSDRLAQEIESSLLGESGDGVRWDGVNEVGEPQLSLHNLLSMLAKVDSLLELVWILIEEKEGKSCHELLLPGGNDFDPVLSLLVVV